MPNAGSIVSACSFLPRDFSRHVVLYSQNDFHLPYSKRGLNSFFFHISSNLIQFGIFLPATQNYSPIPIHILSTTLGLLLYVSG